MSARQSRARDSSAQQDQVPELSCEACNERKVRCDKRNPCSACQVTGVVCIPIQRKRLPRGRQVKENKELRERLARLESLIATNHSSSPTHSSNSTPISSTSASIPSSVTAGVPVGVPSGIPPVSGPGAIFCPPSDVTTNSTSLAALQHPLSLTPLDDAVPASPSASLPKDKRPASPPRRYLANAFWSDLVDKNPGLHGVLSDQSVDREQLDNTNNNHDPGDPSKIFSQQYSHVLQQRGPSSVLGLGFRSHSQNPQSYIDAALALRPAPAVCKKLCEAYLHRVDPIVRVLHRPSLINLLLGGKPYLGYHDTSPVLDVLRSAVFVVAVVSLTEEQCHSIFETDRTSFITTYRLACEVALDRAGLITTEDITVLQSFVLYLIAVRSYDHSRTAWTLFPIAVRLAIALGLNIDSSHQTESFFEQQMRRRLWYTICVLDVHSSFDRGSEPVIGHKSIHPRLPLNINDSEFGPDSEDYLSDKEGLTDMTKALVQYHAQATGKALGIAYDGLVSTATATSKTLSPRQQMVEQFELTTRKLIRFCDPNSSPYAWSTFNGSLTALATMQLSLRRPMNPRGRKGIAMDTDPTKVLRLATTVLERDTIMRSDSRGEPFRWFGVVHWHPLAVAIAECYVCDDIALLRHVWPTIENSFGNIGKVLADYRQGMMWKPLERLMLKTRSRISTLFKQIDAETHTGPYDHLAYVNISTGLDPSAYGSTAMPLPSSNSMDLPLTAMPTPYNLVHAPPIHLQIAETSTENGRAGWIKDLQGDTSWQQKAPSTSLQPAAISTQSNEGIGMMDVENNTSFWQQMMPSISDAGWDAWDDFINNFNANGDNDTMVV